MSSPPKRGELWWCEPPEIGRRPVVVLSRDAAIPRLRRALVAPCTTTIRGLPSEVVLDPSEDPIGRLAAVNLDSVESISVAVTVTAAMPSLYCTVWVARLALTDGASFTVFTVSATDAVADPP